MAQTREQLVDFCRKVYAIHAASVGLEVKRHPRNVILYHKSLTGGQKHYMLMAQDLLWPETSTEDTKD